jgi:hypothetical protein
MDATVIRETPQRFAYIELYPGTIERWSKVTGLSLDRNPRLGGYRLPREERG